MINSVCVTELIGALKRTSEESLLIVRVPDHELLVK